MFYLSVFGWFVFPDIIVLIPPHFCCQMDQWLHLRPNPSASSSHDSSVAVLELLRTEWQPKRNVNAGNKADSPKKVGLTPKERPFVVSWQNDSPWLCYDKQLGMWCETCLRHANDEEVRFSNGKNNVNSLCQPTFKYRFENIDGHERKACHLRAVHLDSIKTAPVVCVCGGRAFSPFLPFGEEADAIPPWSCANAGVNRLGSIPTVRRRSNLGAPPFRRGMDEYSGEVCM